MGAWGSGPFENDGAGDLVASIRAGEFSFDELGWAFEDDYLEVDGGQIALALVDLALVGVGVQEAAPEVADLDLTVFRSDLTHDRVDWILTVADRTLSGSEDSELYELWEETEDLDGWLRPAHAAVDELRSYRERVRA